MYVYNVGIVDHFHGLTHLSNYIKRIKECQGVVIGEMDEDLDSLREFVIEALCEALNAKGLAWEGDLRNDAIYLGGIPMANDDLNCGKFLVIKQDNNGSTFVISPVAFEHLKGELIDSGSDDQYSGLDELPYEVSEIIATHFG